MTKTLASMFLITVLCMGASLNAEERSVRIYRRADPGELGRSSDRSNILSVDLTDFARGEPLALESPVLTAYLVKAEVVEQLQSLTKNGGSGETPRLKAERLGPLTYRIAFPLWKIENVYRFDPPDESLAGVISDYYSNVYWRETVSGEYANNYTVTVLQAMDILNPRGMVDFTEALLAAALVSSRNQPLWGIHDGLGLLDGLGYALTEAQNQLAHETYNYRDYEVNKRQMQELVLRLMQSDSNLSRNLHSMVNGLVQFERDEVFLLPEELIEEGEGDCLEFALCYYDLLRRVGCEVKVLAIRAEEDYEGELSCNFITVYRKEDFAPWGYVYYAGFEEVSFENWDEIPGQIVRDSAYYYPINPEESMRERSVYLPPRDLWSISKY